MAKRRVSKLKYFHGDIELIDVQWVKTAEIGHDWSKGFPHYDPDMGAPRTQAGHRPKAAGEAITFAHLEWLPVERIIKYLASPDPHVCDWRCEGAYKTSECRCSCGGRNHGIKACAEVSL